MIKNYDLNLEIIFYPMNYSSILLFLVYLLTFQSTLIKCDVLHDFEIILPPQKTLGVKIDTDFRITEFIHSSYAKKLGLKLGDQIYKLDDSELLGFTLQQFLEKLRENFDFQRNLMIRPQHTHRFSIYKF